MHPLEKIWEENLSYHHFEDGLDEVKPHSKSQFWMVLPPEILKNPIIFFVCFSGHLHRRGIPFFRDLASCPIGVEKGISLPPVHSV